MAANRRGMGRKWRGKVLESWGWARVPEEGRVLFAGWRVTYIPCGVRPVPPFPGAPVNSPDGQTAPKTPLSPATRHDPARHSAAPLPAGQTASTPHTSSAPCPKGKAASPNAPQAAGPCSWACRRQHPPPPHPKRNEAHPPPARGAGVLRIRANGSGRRHCRSRRRASRWRRGRCRQGRCRWRTGRHTNPAIR